MKSGIHPDYVETTVHCGCGATFTTRSTKKSGQIQLAVFPTPDLSRERRPGVGLRLAKEAAGVRFGEGGCRDG